MNRNPWVITLLLCAAGSPASARAGGPAVDSYDGVDETGKLDVHGLFDGYVLHNTEEPSSGRNQLREFDGRVDRPSLGLLRLTLARHPARLGFRADLGIGDMADAFFQEDPASAAYPELSRWMSRIEQAFVTVALPEVHELFVDLGKFGTPVGFEDNESVANWNYSRSLLYSLAEPSTHTGVRITYRRAPLWAVSAFWVNGWNSNLLRGSQMRTFAAAGSWKPNEIVDVVFVYMCGLERAPTNPQESELSFRGLLGAYATYRPARDVSFALTADYGHDQSGGGVNFGGFAAYARLQVTDWLAGAVRGEYLTDPDAFVTSSRQNLAEATTTAEVRCGSECGPVLLLGRLEFRHDQSTGRIFDGRNSTSLNHQDTLTLALIAGF